MQRNVGAIEILHEYSLVTLLKVICFLSSFVGQKKINKNSHGNGGAMKDSTLASILLAGHNNQWIIKPGFVYQFSKLIHGYTCISIVSVFQANTRLYIDCISFTDFLDCLRSAFSLKICLVLISFQRDCKPRRYYYNKGLRSDEIYFSTPSFLVSFRSRPEVLRAVTLQRKVGDCSQSTDFLFDDPLQ